MDSSSGPKTQSCESISPACERSLSSTNQLHIQTAATDNFSSKETHAEPSCPSPETLQVALDAFLSEISLLTCCTTESSDDKGILEMEEYTPGKVFSTIPHHHNHYEPDTNLHYYGIL